MNVPLLDTDQAWARWRARRAGGAPAAYAMFSTLLGGIVSDPALMFVPVDDHLVHRGDGVFETLRCVDGAIYALAPHLDRLRHSAEGIGLSVPLAPADLAAAVVHTARAAGRPDAMLRVIVARGPGGFSVNPYDCPAAQVYAIAYPASAPFMAKHPEGARVRTSAIPLKPGLLATSKTCNYLPNALMKKEAVDAGVDFTVTFDERGFLGEGAVENAAIVTADGRLRIPTAERILAGITMGRVAEIAAADPARVGLRGVETGRIARAEVETAAEILILGTSVEVAAVVEFDGRPVGGGRPGRVAAALGRLLAEDLRTNAAWRTAVRD